MVNTVVKNIFGANCERFWAAGLPVMPLAVADKKPVIMNWQSLQSRMPTDNERFAWRTHYRDNNIGLPLGPQSGLVAIDIDTDDDRIMKVLMQVLPISPWKRVGQRGLVMLYKYEGQPIIHIRYKDKDGKMQGLVDMLGAGSQVVLPPSIHPKTEKPYYANCDLLEVLEKIPSLPPNIDQLLREALKKIGIEAGSGGTFGSAVDYVSTGSRDTTLVSFAGLFARAVLKGERTLLEACQEIELKASAFMEKTYGDTIDPKKGPQKLIEFLIRDVTGPKGKVLPKGWDEGITADQRKKWGLTIFDEDSEVWDAQEIRDYFTSHVEKAGVKDNPDLFLDVVSKVLIKISTAGLKDMAEDALLTYIAQVSGKRVTVSSLRKELKALRAGEIEGVSHAEIAAAVVRDFEELGGEVRFYLDTLWQWNGSAWSELEPGEIVSHVVREYGHYPAARKNSDHNGIMRTVRDLTRKPLRNSSISGVNFVNGYLTEELELLPHHPDYGQTYTLGYPYSPDKAGKCPRWQKMLVDYWGDDPDFWQKSTCLGELMALTLFNKMTNVQKAVCLYGVPNSGKSRIMEIMIKLMPESATTSLPPTMWSDKFGPSKLVGRLLNVAGELSEKLMIDAAMFKQIVSGEMIDAQDKNKPSFSFRPRTSHWFATNHLPMSRDSSEGFTRRWVFLNFFKVFPSSEEIPNYDEIVIAEEREAIAAWAVQHIVRLRSENLRITEPASSVETREQLANELNSVRDFLVGFRQHGWVRLGKEANAGRSDDHNYTSFSTIFNEYRSYCASQSVSPVGSKQMAKRLVQLQGQFGIKLDNISGAQGLPIQVFRYMTFVQDRKMVG